MFSAALRAEVYRFRVSPLNHTAPPGVPCVAHARIVQRLKRQGAEAGRFALSHRMTGSMVLRSLRLRSFRAHAATEVSFAPGVNLLHGPNGAGKTNVLEAIHYLCLTKSFTAARDRYAVRNEAPYFELDGTFTGVRRSETDVRLVYMPGEGKQVFINGAPLERLSDIVGRLPIVVFSPDDHDLTAGGPKYRRQFLNNILCQAHPACFEDTLAYRRARRQRTEVLRQYKGRSQSPPPSLVEPWTEKLVTVGSRVIQRRLAFLDTFRTYLEAAYERIEDVAERPSIAYDTVDDLAGDASVAHIEDVFRDTLQRRRDAEHQRGTTMAGPQRDELIFRLNDLEVRRYGSQGQHRTFGMALKLAQYFYLCDRLDDQPLLLLDDAFGKLDARRTDVFLQLLQSDRIGQTFITATRRGPFATTVDFHTSAHCALQVCPGEDGAAHVASSLTESDAAPDTKNGSPDGTWTHEAPASAGNAPPRQKSAS